MPLRSLLAALTLGPCLALGALLSLRSLLAALALRTGLPLGSLLPLLILGGLGGLTRLGLRLLGGTLLGDARGRAGGGRLRRGAGGAGQDEPRKKQGSGDGSSALFHGGLDLSRRYRKDRKV